MSNLLEEKTKLSNNNRTRVDKFLTSSETNIITGEWNFKETKKMIRDYYMAFNETEAASFLKHGCGAMGNMYRREAQGEKPWESMEEFWENHRIVLQQSLQQLNYHYNYRLILTDKKADLVNSPQLGLISWNLTPWPSLCAAQIMSALRWNSRLVFGPTTSNTYARSKLTKFGRELFSRFGKEFKTYCASYHATYMVAFSASSEEIRGQVDVAKQMGFVDFAPPYVSTKTGHIIHNLGMVLASEESQRNVQVRNAHARERLQKDGDMWEWKLPTEQVA